MKIILFFFDFKNIFKKKTLFNKKKFQIDFKSETKYSPKFPEETEFPQSPRNDKLIKETIN